MRTAMRKSIQKIRAPSPALRGGARGARAASARQAAKALAIEGELTTGLAGLATRSRSWIRLAVSGDDARTARERAEQVRDLYTPQINVHRPLDQYKVAREFIPGEPMAATAHVRRMPVVTLAAAMPNATAQWGDHGIPLGETAGTSVQAAVLDFWDAPEHNESGLCVVSAGLGGGKTTWWGGSSTARSWRACPRRPGPLRPAAGAGEAPGAQGPLPRGRPARRCAGRSRAVPRGGRSGARALPGRRRVHPAHAQRAGRPP